MALFSVSQKVVPSAVVSGMSPLCLQGGAAYSAPAFLRSGEGIGRISPAEASFFGAHGA